MTVNQNTATSNESHANVSRLLQLYISDINSPASVNLPVSICYLDCTFGAIPSTDTTGVLLQGKIMKTWGGGGGGG